MRNEGKKWAGGDSVTGTWGLVDDLVSREKHIPPAHPPFPAHTASSLWLGLHLLGSCWASKLIHSANTY